MAETEEPSLCDDRPVDDGDRQHFEKVCATFRCYRRFELNRIGVAERQFLSIPERHQALLPNHLVQLAHMAECVDTNYQFILKILEGNDTIFENADLSASDPHQVPHKKARLNGTEECEASDDHQHACASMHVQPARVLVSDVDKVRSTLKQFVRDWSAEGACERRACYEPVLNELSRRFPNESNRGGVRVLLPGAGLCRLAWEVARLGFDTHANEVSFYMLLAANFVLNRCSRAEEFVIHPFVHESCNNRRFADQVAAVRIPDCDPTALALAAASSGASGYGSTRFEMSAGDFVEIYSRPTECGRYDCIVTMFFIDTAHNIVEYVETLRAALRPGGLWINLGPLLFHYADMPSELSIEIAYDELRALILRSGFDIDLERSISTGYCQKSFSMLEFVYHTQFFVARKL